MRLALLKGLNSFPKAGGGGSSAVSGMDVQSWYGGGSKVGSWKEGGGPGGGAYSFRPGGGPKGEAYSSRSGGPGGDAYSSQRVGRVGGSEQDEGARPSKGSYLSSWFWKDSLSLAEFVLISCEEPEGEPSCASG